MELLIRFEDQSQSFTNGVEFGRILAKLERGEEFAQNSAFPVRIENKMVLVDACMAYGYTATFGEEKDGWVNFIAIKKIFTRN